MLDVFKLKEQIKYNYSNKGKDTMSSISPQDLKRINSATSYMWKVPLLFGTIYTVALKGLEMMTLSELFYNPLRQSSQTNENITKTFRRAFKVQGLAMSSLLGFAIGLGLCEASKFNMFLKYQNLVNSYIQSSNREWKDKITFKDQTFTK